MFENLTDDQIAILGCLGALATSVLLMTICYWLGDARRQVGRAALRRLPSAPNAAPVVRTSHPAPAPVQRKAA
jgi:hypothetical protein